MQKGKKGFKKCLLPSQTRALNSLGPQLDTITQLKVSQTDVLNECK